MLVDDELLRQINCTASIVIATSPNFSHARQEQRIATIKSAPFAVAQPQLEEVVKILRGGCIIRSVMLDKFYEIFRKSPELPNLLLDESVAQMIKGAETSMRRGIARAVEAGYPVSGLNAALGYFDSYRRGHLPINLIQAQRDYFGSHTYQRVDEAGSFHTDWDA